MTVTWPPQYSLRKSKRVRNIHIKISPRHGLEVVVPYRCNPQEWVDVLDSKRSWVEKHLQNINTATHAEIQNTLPTQINLPAIDQVWQINYIATDSRHKIIIRPQNELVVIGDISQKDNCKKLLVKWLREHAKAQLLPWLQRVSAETGLLFTGANVRGQISRWGSCTANKAISLNYKLLFLPSEIVRHILIHELCHTVHLNHSAKFWQLVEYFDPNWRQYRQESRRMQNNVPLWVE